MPEVTGVITLIFELITISAILYQIRKFIQAKDELSTNSMPAIIMEDKHNVSAP